MSIRGMLFTAGGAGTSVGTLLSSMLTSVRGAEHQGQRGGLSEGRVMQHKYLYHCRAAACKDKKAYTDQFHVAWDFLVVSVP